MVFASICDHAGSECFFASTSSEQFSHASSEYFTKYKWRAAALRKFSASYVAGISLSLESVGGRSAGYESF